MKRSILITLVCALCFLNTELTYAGPAPGPIKHTSISAVIVGMTPIAGEKAYKIPTFAFDVAYTFPGSDKISRPFRVPTPPVLQMTLERPWGTPEGNSDWRDWFHLTGVNLYKQINLTFGSGSGSLQIVLPECLATQYDITTNATGQMVERLTVSFIRYQFVP